MCDDEDVFDSIGRTVFFGVCLEHGFVCDLTKSKQTPFNSLGSTITLFCNHRNNSLAGESSVTNPVQANSYFLFLITHRLDLRIVIVTYTNLVENRFFIFTHVHDYPPSSLPATNFNT